MGDRVTPVVVDDTRAAAVKDALQVCQGGCVHPRSRVRSTAAHCMLRSHMHACMHAHMLRCKRTHPLQEFRSFARPGSKPKVLIMSYTTFRCAAAQDACCTCTAFCCMHARRAELLQEPCTVQHTNANGRTT